MPERVLEFIKKYDSILLTTHDGADADGLGAELVFHRIIKETGKEVQILNAAPMAHRFSFMDPDKKVGVWDEKAHDALARRSALMILDTSDEYFIGSLRKALDRTRENFVLDHHEPNPLSALKGFTDPSASSTCELAVEIAGIGGIPLDRDTAMAAYAGIIYDTGSFAYTKTTARTFRAALSLVEAGVIPYQVWSALNESGTTAALLLRKRIISNMEIRAGGRAAVLIMRKEDLESTGACFEDAESFINVPLKAKETAVSIMIKENSAGEVRCSLRSKGKINVSMIARLFGGGGHVTAAGFRSSLGIDDTLEQVLEKLDPLLETK
ncbi:MAG: bifunctional oligoribonuclease/PAP phosphatase NrnA [Treponema sp.]|jgi:phosphoesterase RecJ-like protein|nr:bifunctional oligoribonuclease/PAP phosphatase NrnA [Treponema sp.]